mgnify:CR=1 FL=1
MSFLWPMVLWLAALVAILAALDAWLSRGGDGKSAWPQIRRGVAAGEIGRAHV